MKLLFFIIFFCFISLIVFSELRFSPLSLTDSNTFLFNSIEKIGGNSDIKTLFYGYLENEKTKFEPLSFYPEDLFYTGDNKVIIQNKMGLYYYDLVNNKVVSFTNYPSFSGKDEYVIYRQPKIAISPNMKYIVGKYSTSTTRSSIYLYDIANNTKYEVVKDVETSPGSDSAKWSKDSNYFIYQKNNSIYYYPINDFLKKKIINEDWRRIGKVTLKNCYWTGDNHLLWIEDNVIYQADPNQFFYRSIYKSYLRQGDIIGKVPFNLDYAFDSFVYNDKTRKFLVVKDGSSIYYYSLTNDLKQNPYLQLNDNMRFDSCFLFDNGEGIIILKILSKGILNSKILLLKQKEDEFFFTDLNADILKDTKISGISINKENYQFVVNSGKGAFCFDFKKNEILWSYNKESIVDSVNVGNNKWVLGGIYTGVFADIGVSSNLSDAVSGKTNRFTPIFACSIDNAGFINKDREIGVVINNETYSINKDTKSISVSAESPKNFNKNEKNVKYRLLSREIKKGFYRDGVYLKDLYSGYQYEVTGLPNLSYKLYQPEITLDYSYFDTPEPNKYETALVFNCIKSAEGMFPILTTLNNFQIKSTFFLNGNFIQINPAITKELSFFDMEIGNLFQYYVSLTDNNFLIDANFIRQGLSSNEETYYNVTGKNFAPYWHSPYYTFNDSIVKFGLDSGYKYVSFQLDSLDWVSPTSGELDKSYFMNNSELIERILTKLKPGQIIIFNAGKNSSLRSDYLFNDLDLLISELVRSGYTFTVASDIAEKYRDK